MSKELFLNTAKAGGVLAFSYLVRSCDSAPVLDSVQLTKTPGGISAPPVDLSAETTVAAEVYRAPDTPVSRTATLIPTPELTETATLFPPMVTNSPTIEISSTEAAVSVNSIKGKDIFVNPNSQLVLAVDALKNTNPALAETFAEVAEQPIGIWLGEWSRMTDIEQILQEAASSNTVPMFVAYNIPHRDLGQYSAGGLESDTAYLGWITEISNTIRNSDAVIILEPDALPHVQGKEESLVISRTTVLRDAVTILKTNNPNVSVYLDIGHSKWLPVSDAVSLLQAAGIDVADGFSINVSNFQDTDDSIGWGEQIAQQVGKGYIVDTSRNGNGPPPDDVEDSWCNPRSVGLGEAPTTNPEVPNAPNLQAYIWAKVPGESDGECDGNPPAGTFSESLLENLVKNSPYY